MIDNFIHLESKINNKKTEQQETSVREGMRVRGSVLVVQKRGREEILRPPDNLLDGGMKRENDTWGKRGIGKNGVHSVFRVARKEKEKKRKKKGK